MPRWLESTIAEHVHKLEDQKTDATVTRGGTNTTVTDGSGSENVTSDAKTTTKDGTVTNSDEISSMTRGGSTETTAETSTQTATETKTDDAGAVITFSIRITGGMGNSSANPSI